MRVLVIGAGAWGTTLAKLLAENQHQVTIWAHDQALVREISQEHTNKLLLPNIKLPEAISATDNFRELDKYEIIFIVVASKFYKNVLQQIKPLISAKQIMVSATKGLTEEGETLSTLLEKYLGQNYVVFSGPNIAKEIAQGKPAAAVAASKIAEAAHKVQQLFSGTNLRVYTSEDVAGVEAGGTLKNVIAIAAGLADGLQLGDNAKAALMVRGIVEIARLATALGAQEKTLYGLTGLGDLITTCSSSLSRNHHVGEELAKGKKLTEILAQMVAVAEGVSTAKYAYQLAQKLKISMPITEQIYQVLFADESPQVALNKLMARTPKPEAG